MAVGKLGLALALLCLISGSVVARELHGERIVGAAWGQ